MEGEAGFFIIAVVGLTSLILPLASAVMLVNLSSKIEDLEKKVEKKSGGGGLNTWNQRHPFKRVSSNQGQDFIKSSIF